MLTKMYLTNFLSFCDRTAFDFTASKYSILSQTNVSDNDILKGALVIGPNASGKSNVLKAIGFLVELIKGDGVSFPDYHCNFAKSSVTTVEYEFRFKKQTIHYAVSFDILNFELSEKLSIDEKEVLTRKGARGELKISGSNIIEDQLDDSTLFLRTASFNTGKFPQEPALRELMEFLFNSYFIDGYNHYAHFGKNITKYAETNGVEKLNNYLQDFNYDFFLEYGSESEGQGLQITLGSGQKSVFFKRKNFPIPNTFNKESQGNQVFADMLPQLISVIEKPGLLVIDEFGNSLHNKLAERIAAFFMEKSQHSQLFITSHDTNLISNSVFRPDQINLITFENALGSKVERISKYKPREAQNLEKMYLGGMFEGLPIYD